jgi:prepilin-type N-terminal cleavage/methylation domain-containing protein
MNCSERGFSLMEVIVAMVIATIAVIGLAFTFGTGQGLIHRFDYARAALASAQQRMEAMAVAGPTDAGLAIGTHQSPFLLDGVPLGMQEWTVEYVDDPSDGIGGADADGNPNDLKRVTLEVTWQTGSMTDMVRLTRYFLPQ